MAVKKRAVGELYFNGEKIADQCESITESVEYTEEQAKKMFNIPMSFTLEIRDIRIKRNSMLSLMYGMKITNNYLKLHGGIMEREVAGRKGKRKLR